MKLRRHSGFTIVELIVVIVVIGILAAITIVSYNGVQTRAKASALASDINTVEKAFKLYLTFTNQAEYPNDVTFGAGDNPELQAVINANSDFREQLKAVPSPQYRWVVDIDNVPNPPGTTCNTLWLGAVIMLYNVPPNVAQQLDKDIDDGDLNCGKIQGSGTTYQYTLSFDKKP